MIRDNKESNRREARSQPKYIRLYRLVFVICALNVLIHLCGQAVFPPYLSQAILGNTLGPEGGNLKGGVLTEDYAFISMIATIQIQVGVCIGIIVILIVRRGYARFLAHTPIDLETLNLIAVTVPATAIIGAYAFGGSFLLKWTIERPPWFMIGLLSLLTCGTLLALLLGALDPLSARNDTEGQENN